MGIALGAIGLLGFIGCLVLFLILLIARKSKEAAKIGMMVCAILFFVGILTDIVSGDNAERRKASQIDQSISSQDTSTGAGQPDVSAPTVVTPDISSKENENSNTEVVDTTKTDIKGTSLFEDVYVPYASREKTTVLFQGVKVFAENCGYSYEITEGDESSVTSIKIIENDDYVYFAFSTNSAGIETIMTVSYYQSSSNSEVSLSNYSTDGDFSYDKLDTHIIGESSIEVDNIEQQREFLFAQ